MYFNPKDNKVVFKMICMFSNQQPKLSNFHKCKKGILFNTPTHVVNTYT